MPYSFTMSPKIYQRSLLLVTVINNGTGMFTTCAFVQPGSWLAPGLVGASYCCWLGFPGVLCPFVGCSGPSACPI